MIPIVFHLHTTKELMLKRVEMLKEKNGRG